MMGFDVQKIKQKLFHRDSDSNEEDFMEEDGYSSGDVSYDYGAVRWKRICRKATRFLSIDLWLHRSIGWGFHAIYSSVKLYSLSSAG